MKLIIEKKQLLKHLMTVRGALEQRQTYPILSHLHIAVRDGRLTITATDNEVEIRTHVALDDWSDGETTIPGKKLIGICQALPEDATVEISLDGGNKALLRSGRNRFALSTLPANEYPTTGDIADGASFAIGQSELRRLIDLTQFAMAHNDMRYYLNGLLIEIEPRRLATVATDGHRLAVAHASADTGVEESKSIIVPRKGITELARLLTKEETDLTARMDANAIQISIGDIRFTSKLIDAKFPDYRRVIPDDGECDKRLSIDREALRQCLIRTSVLSSQKHRAVRLILDDDALKITANNAERETAEDELEVEYAKDRLEIEFNVSYLIDALTTLPSETADLFFTNASSSCLIQAQGQSNCQFVVMPMRM